LPRSEQAAPVAPVWFQHEHARPVQAYSPAGLQLSAGARVQVWLQHERVRPVRVCFLAAPQLSAGVRVRVWFQHEHARPVQACSLAGPQLSAGMRERVRGRALELGEIRQLAAWLRTLPQAV
jgi:hypothetical protein